MEGYYQLIGPHIQNFEFWVNFRRKKYSFDLHSEISSITVINEKEKYVFHNLKK